MLGVVELFLQREEAGAHNTLGRLLVNGSFGYYTLEDLVRHRKIAGETAIPAGRYRVRLTYSPRFGRLMPSVEGVPGFSGVRIHSGNDHQDTEGCILVGMAKGQLDGDPDPEILQSRAAYSELFGRLKRVDDLGEEIWLTIQDPPPQAA